MTFFTFYTLIFVNRCNFQPVETYCFFNARFQDEMKISSINITISKNRIFRKRGKRRRNRCFPSTAFSADDG